MVMALPLPLLLEENIRMLFKRYVCYTVGMFLLGLQVNLVCNIDLYIIAVDIIAKETEYIDKI